MTNIIAPVEGEIRNLRDVSVDVEDNVVGLLDASDLERSGTVCTTFSISYLRRALDVADTFQTTTVTLEVGHDLPLILHPESCEAASVAVAPQTHVPDSSDRETAAEGVPGYTDPIPGVDADE